MPGWKLPAESLSKRRETIVFSVESKEEGEYVEEKDQVKEEKRLSGLAVVRWVWQVSFSLCLSLSLSLSLFFN